MFSGKPTGLPVGGTAFLLSSMSMFLRISSRCIFLYPTEGFSFVPSFTFAITEALPAVSGFAISSGTAILSAGREQICYVVSQLYIGLNNTYPLWSLKDRYNCPLPSRKRPFLSAMSTSSSPFPVQRHCFHFLPFYICVAHDRIIQIEVCRGCKMKKYAMPIIMLVVFETVAITLWLTKNNLFYLFNFSYIGLSISLGVFLYIKKWLFGRTCG